jgi:hypothetical protein
VVDENWIMRTGERVVMTVGVVAVLGAATLAMAAAGEAVDCSNPATCRSAIIAEHYKVGVPVPRLRSFANAPWTGAKAHQTLKPGEFLHE